MSDVKYTITVNEKENKISVTNSKGETVELEGFVLFGGDAELGVTLAIGHGASADAAWSTGLHFNNPGFKNYFIQIAAHIVQSINPTTFHQEADPEEVLERWERDKREKDIKWN